MDWGRRDQARIEEIERLRNEIKAKDKEINRLRKEAGLPSAETVKNAKEIGDLYRRMGSKEFELAVKFYYKDRFNKVVAIRQLPPTPVDLSNGYEKQQRL